MADDLPLEIHLIVGARPNFMKIAPLYHALAGEPWARPRLVHTGQHYDPLMSDAFFRDLGLNAPDFQLGAGSGSHAQQTGRIMVAYEQLTRQHRPDVVIVVGDVNSTLACALVGAKEGVPVVHLEAGLRSGDRSMPEEINRRATDAVTDVFWTPSRDANDNLAAEGVPLEQVDFVGSLMIDSLCRMREAIAADPGPSRLGLAPRGYAIVTLHRPANVDDPRVLASLVEQLTRLATSLPLVFAVHPRTRDRLATAGCLADLEAAPGIQLLAPLGYVQFLSLVAGARAVITDSGGLQEETTYLGIPCLTLRANTERPVTISEGTNRLVRPADLAAGIAEVLDERWPTGRCPELWDGRAAERCTAALHRRFAGGTQRPSAASSAKPA